MKLTMAIAVMTASMMVGAVLGVLSGETLSAWIRDHRSHAWFMPDSRCGDDRPPQIRAHPGVFHA